jgi:hypothetical protein
LSQIPKYKEITKAGQEYYTIYILQLFQLIMLKNIWATIQTADEDTFSAPLSAGNFI